MTAAFPSRRPRLVILGAGCAGLSLAYRLARATPCLDVLLVETRTDYIHDRTWSGFHLASHPFEDCRMGKWQQLEVKGCDTHTRLDCGRYFYESIHSGHFYQQCLATLDAAPNVHRLHARVKRLVPAGNPPGVVLENGDILHGDWIVDTLPRPVPLKAPWRWQDFAGWELESTELARQPPVLMDFSVTAAEPVNGALDFIYRLPFSDNRVLLEWTRFGRPAANPLELEQNLKRYLDRSGISDYRLVRREYGSLPMAPGRRSTQQHHVLAGSYGGAMRASTGYAFHAIQRWADLCTQQLLKGNGPTAPHTSALLRPLDAIFMQALEHAGDDAHELYTTLFQHCRGEPLVRFLSGLPAPQDYASIMAALPTTTMLKAAWQSALQRLPYLPTLRPR